MGKRSLSSAALSIAFSVGLITGCSEPSRISMPDEDSPNENSRAAALKTEPPAELSKALEEVADAQSEGMREATTTVHRAYIYQGYSYIEPIENAKRVAVDVEFLGYGEGLDLDDIDIIDGSSDENFGISPHIELMAANGRPVPNAKDSDWPAAGKPLRVLLIYAVPETTNSIKLGYWGHTLTDKATTLGAEGPSLEKPVE